MTRLIADSGSTKTEWYLSGSGQPVSVFTQGLSPYFLNGDQIVAVLQNELLPHLQDILPDQVFFYGTGCAAPENAALVTRALQRSFPGAAVEVQHDLMGAARALCGREPGIACILGTGSNSCYFDGETIIHNSPGLGYVLGDEGSGAYLGKKVLQYYLYKTFDEDLMFRFEERYKTNKAEILDQVYKKPLANRYLASFALFLKDNRNHFMIENIIEDGLNDFFFTHLCKYAESWTKPIHFTGSISFGFQDVIRDLCTTYEFEAGKILQAPMEGLKQYHG